MNWTKDYLERYGRNSRLSAGPRPSFALSDRFPVPTGILSIDVLDGKTKEIVQKITGENLVVNGGRYALSHLFAGDDVANQKIAQMSFGDGVVAPAVTDTALSGTVIITVNNPGSLGDPTTHWDTPTYPVSTPQTKVQFIATIGTADGNGSGSQNYTEAGLPCANANLAARKVFGLITKTSDLIIVATWTLTF